MDTNYDDSVQNALDVLKIVSLIEESELPEKLPLTWAFQQLTASLAFSRGVTKYSTRVEGNALTALCFRNGPLEGIHAGERSLDDDAMKDLMIWSSRAMTGALALKEMMRANDLGRLWEEAICAYHAIYCGRWELSNDAPMTDDELVDFDDDDDEE